MAARKQYGASDYRKFAEAYQGGAKITDIARKMDIARSTITDWRNAIECGNLVVTDKHVKRDGVILDEEDPKRNDPNALRKAHKEIDKLTRELEKMQERLEQARKPRVSFKPHQAPAKKGYFNRLFITDTHGNKVDRQAFEAMLADIEQMERVQEVVLGGDILDCDGFLTEHVPQYLAQFEYSFEDDIRAANQQLDELQKLCPKAKFYYIEGNHDHRIERWIAKQKINATDSEGLYRRNGPEAVLSLQKRGIYYVRQSQQHMGLKTRGVIKLGHCYFVHGTTTSSKTASQKNVQKYAANVVHGHNHSMQQAASAFMDGQQVMASCPGCLCQMNPMYNHSDPCTWTHGYGLQVANQDGSFHHINVPLNNGRSFLAHL